MKQPSAAKPKKPIDWDAVSERARQRGNRLTEEERERIQDEALRIIYGADVQAFTPVPAA